MANRVGITGIGRAAETSNRWMPHALGVLLVLYVSATPSQFLFEMVSSGPLIHVFRGYGKAALLTTLLGALLILGRRVTAIPSRRTVFLLLGAALIYVTLDITRYDGDIRVFQIAKDALYNKVTSSYLIAVSVFGFLLMLDQKWRRADALRTVMIASTVAAAFGLAVWLGIESRVFSFGDYGVTNNNTQAYESMGVLLLLLWLARERFSAAGASFIAAVHGMVPLLNRSRGAMLVTLLMFAGYFAFSLSRRGWRPVVQGSLDRTLAVISLVLAAGVLGMLDPTTVATPMRVAVATIRGKPVPPPVRQVVVVNRSEQWNATVIIGNLRQLMKSSRTKHNLESNREISDDDDVVSAYSRLGTTLLAVRAYLSSPIVGIGIWNAYGDIEVASFGIHGLLPLLLAAYGTLGLIPMAGMLGLLVTAPTEGVVRFQVLVVILMIAMLVNVYPPWWGIVLWAFTSNIRPTGLEAARHVASDHTDWTVMAR
jgi:hypothetical protein